MPNKLVIIAVKITKIMAATKVVYLRAPAGFPFWKALIIKGEGEPEVRSGQKL